VAVLAAIAVVMTVGVYGLVAGIVKLDDAGLYLSRFSNAVFKLIGNALLAGAPMLMKALSVLGTIAMFMVGGGILMHAVPALHHLVDGATAAAACVPGVGGLLKVVTPALVDAVAGLIAGAVALVVVTVVTRVFKRKGAAAA
jgi:predicted DNA repair protein MutK